MPRTPAKVQKDRDDRRRANEARARTLLPELRLHIWAKPEGVCVDARIETLRPEGHRGQETIAHVTFRPREVTEDLVVQWAIGALSTWLQGKAEAAAEAVHSSS